MFRRKTEEEIRQAEEGRKKKAQDSQHTYTNYVADSGSYSSHSDCGSGGGGDSGGCGGGD